MSSVASSSANTAPPDPKQLGRQHGAAVMGGQPLPTGTLPVPKKKDLFPRGRVDTGVVLTSRERWLRTYFEGFDEACPGANTSGFFQRGWSDGVNGADHRFLYWTGFATTTKPAAAKYAYDHSFSLGKASAVPELTRGGSASPASSATSVSPNRRRPQQQDQRTFGHSGRGPQ